MDEKSLTQVLCIILQRDAGDLFPVLSEQLLGFLPKFVEFMGGDFCSAMHPLLGLRPIMMVNCVEVDIA